MINHTKRDIECCVVGLGYIGLPTAAIIASKGITVTGIDINNNVINTVNNGSIHIYEPELKTLVEKVVKDGFLKAQKFPIHSDVYIIAVPTPFINNKSKILKKVFPI